MSKLPRNAKLYTPSLQWLNDMLQLFSTDAITIPPLYRDRVLETKTLLENDASGLTNSLLDFAISCASVDYYIETDNENVTKIFQDWLSHINEGWRGKIPVGIKALAKEYFRERWKGSSLLLLRTLWNERDGFQLPTQLAFVDGEDIIIKNGDADEPVIIGAEQYKLRINDKESISLPKEKNEMLFVQKPYESWGTSYPTPFLIRRGLYENLKFLDILSNKGQRIVGKALEYLLLLKKGTEALTLANNPDFIPSEDELKTLKEDLKKHITDSKSVDGTPVYATMFDTVLEHFIPEYGKIINETIYAPIERKILAGLGLIEVIRGIASDRREAMMNPKPFIAEITNGINDFKTLLTDILQEILIKNDPSHRKYINAKIVIHNTPIKEFITDDIRSQLRSAYDRGVLSKRTYLETVSDADFDIEVERRKTETDDGLNETMYPPLIQNREDIPDPNSEGLPQDVIPEEKTGPEKKNFQGSDEGVFEEAPYKQISDLPEQVKVLPKEAQALWMRVFNKSYPKGEDYARKVAWYVVKKSFRKVKDKWVKKGSINLAEVEKIINSIFERELPEKASVVKDLLELELKEKQLKLANRLLNESKGDKDGSDADI